MPARKLNRAGRFHPLRPDPGEASPPRMGLSRPNSLLLGRSAGSSILETQGHVSGLRKDLNPYRRPLPNICSMSNNRIPSSGSRWSDRVVGRYTMDTWLR